MRTNRSLLTGLIIMAGTTYTQVAAADGYIPLVFGTTYVSAGAGATFGGDIVATTYFVAGASTTVTGSIQTGTAITLGATSTVSVDTDSGTATTLGATVTVTGNANHGTAFTLGAGASRGAQTNNAPMGMNYNSGQVVAQQDAYNLLTLPTPAERNDLETTMPSDITLNPGEDSDSYGSTRIGSDYRTVVYNAASLTTGAGITLTLACEYNYVFNIADMLSLGAETKIVMADVNGDVCVEGRSVTWNMGSYASVGAKAEMIGTVFAYGYISTGVDSVIEGANAASGDFNGGLFSATSYVTIGASGTVNGVAVTGGI